MNITISTKQIKNMGRALRNVGEKKVPRAAMRALNRAAERTRTAVIKETAKDLKVTQKRLKRRVRFQRRDQATTAKLGSQVFLVISDMPVTYLGAARQTKRGVVVKGKLYEGKFKAKMPGGHVGVYGRTGAKRFPIKEVREQVRADMKGIADEQIQTVGEATFRERFKYELMREFGENIL